MVCRVLNGLLSPARLREPHCGITLRVLVVEFDDTLVCQMSHELAEGPEAVIGLGEGGILAEQRPFETRCPDVTVPGPDEPGQGGDDERIR